MNVNVTCACHECERNDKGKCCADMGIVISKGGKCKTYKPRITKSELDSLNKAMLSIGELFKDHYKWE